MVEVFFCVVYFSGQKKKNLNSRETLSFFTERSSGTRWALEDMLHLIVQRSPPLKKKGKKYTRQSCVRKHSSRERADCLQPAVSQKPAKKKKKEKDLQKK